LVADQNTRRESETMATTDNASSFAHSLAALLLSAGMLMASPHSAKAAEAGGLAGWAFVNSDGSLIRGRKVAESSKYGSGRYEVRFKFRIRRCTFSATASNYDVAIAVGEAYQKPRSVFIEIRSTSNQSGDDSAFHLQVFCPPEPA
jgi:hypothetical protein